ncbi:MAG TPA: NAD(P)H-dependent oxidoreductase subunit E [Solirubrobacterales bacterium]|nr:NAD(P)H-dependent oxidoreductase subunit E [Solirubrobacterales bacterium]
MEESDRSEREREQARGGSGEPPVPDEASKPGAGEPAQAGAEVAGDREGAGGAEGAAHPGVEDSAAIQTPAAHEVDVPDDLRAEIEEIVARYPQKRSASIPALFAVQRRYGWCTPEGIRQAAAVMAVSAAFLEAVASFYDLFHLEPAGRHRVLVCTNISCWMRGGDELLRSFCGAAGADPELAAHGGAVSADGELYVSGFECLGACDLAPMASIDERYYGPLDDEDAIAAITALRDGREVLPGKAMAIRPLAGGPGGDPDPRVAGAG